MNTQTLQTILDALQDMIQHCGSLVPRFVILGAEESLNEFYSMLSPQIREQLKDCLFKPCSYVEEGKVYILNMDHLPPEYPWKQNKPIAIAGEEL